MSNHTPGPWKIKCTLDEERFTIWDKEHRLLAVAYNQDLAHKGPDSCVRAIAATPDMLKLLKGTLRYLRASGNRAKGLQRDISALLERIGEDDGD